MAKMIFKTTELNIYKCNVLMYLEYDTEKLPRIMYIYASNEQQAFEICANLSNLGYSYEPSPNITIEITVELYREKNTPCLSS